MSADLTAGRLPRPVAGTRAGEASADDRGIQPSRHREERPTNATARATFGRDPSEIGRARRYVRAVLAAWGLESDVAAVELAVSELVSNALLHGTGDIEVELHRFADRARLVVHDAGSDGAVAPVVRDRAPGDLSPGGWGLRVVDQVSERWGVVAEEGHTQVWMETPPRDGSADR